MDFSDYQAFGVYQAYHYKVYPVNKDQKEKREEKEREVILVIRDRLETVKVCFLLLILALKQNRKE